MKINFTDDKLILSELEHIDLDKSCACGQSFRWEKKNGAWHCVLSSKYVTAAYENNMLAIQPCMRGEEEFYIDYFDLNRNYCDIERAIAEDERISECLKCAAGIRVFNQEPFETLISFIISANNNIKRISGIIERLCVLAGEKIEYAGNIKHAFPSPKAIATLSETELKEIGTGYRAPYILKTARIIADGYNLNGLKNMNTESARKELLRLPGVGPKVADCILLFSLGHKDAFPIDVWIDRALRAMFFNSGKYTSAEVKELIGTLGEVSGILQQYIFFYARENNIKI